MTHYTNINSKLYAKLFEIGGDNLLAIYVKLKYAKNGGIKIYKEKNRNIYHTLKQKTNISVTTLRKYIKILINEKLCYFDTKGNFVLIGTNRINKRYNKNKTIKIQIGSYKDTKLNCFFIRVRNMEKLQTKALNRKYKQKNISSRKDKNCYISKKELDFLKKCEKFGRTSENYTAKTVLSHEGFCKLKKGVLTSKSTGFYWKKKLISSKKIQTKRVIEHLKESTIQEYNSMKYQYRGLIFRGGRLFIEKPSQFTTDMDKNLSPDFNIRGTRPLAF